MIMNFLRFVKHRVLKYPANQRIKRRLSFLSQNKDSFTRGTADWLSATEMQMGGYVSKVSRNIVSEHDPRSARQLASGGMIGGDRMVHHGYANIYAQSLKPYLDRDEDLVILECGILKGTGLGVWSKLFPKAMLIGLDIDLDHMRSNMANLKAAGAFAKTEPILLEFDQFKPDTSALEATLKGRKLDIIIDDGFHSNTTILNTFAALEHLFAKQFVFFAEDNKHVIHDLRKKYSHYDIQGHGELTLVTRT